MIAGHFRYNYQFGPSCDQSVDQLESPTGQCTCVFPRTQDTPFGCSNPVYEEFPLVRGTAVPLAARMSGILTIPVPAGQLDCQYYCDMDVACVGYELGAN